MRLPTVKGIKYYAGNRAALAARLVEDGVSRRAFLRGSSREDGRITLLTVDFGNLTGHVIRLAESFRRHVDPGGRVIAVQNGDRTNNLRLRAHGIETRGFGLNIGHARALDWGLRSVTSEYVLICDPDSFILSDRFRHEIVGRLERFRVAGIVVADGPQHAYYHPICTALATRIWKESNWSWIEDMRRPELPNDVGWEFTRHLGGLESGAILRPTRVASAGHVFEECFTCTWGTSRIHTRGYEREIDGRTSADTLLYQRQWAEWVERVAAGIDDVDGFPVSA